MINQLSSFNVDKNVFAPLQSNGTSYAITKPFTDKQKKEKKKEIEKQKEKRSNKLGYAMASLALVAGFGVFITTQLLSKKSGSNITKFRKFLIEKVATLGKNKHASSTQKIKMSFLDHSHSILAKSHSVFNIASVKDIAFRLSLKRIPVLREFSEGVTNWFEKISIGTSKSAYSGTLLKFDSLYGEFARVNAKLPEHELKNIKPRIEKIKSNCAEICSTESRNERLVQVDEDLNELDEKLLKELKHPKDFMKKVINGQFLAEELATDAKINLQNLVTKPKEIISLNIKDNYKSTKKILDSIDTSIHPSDPKDSNLRALMKEARANLETYKNNNKFYEKSQIIESLNNLNKVLLLERDPKIAKGVAEKIDMLAKNKIGEIQEIMEIYKNNLPEKDYKKIEHKVNKALKLLDFSVDLETDKLFDKIRDLKIGSAPHDVLAFVTSLGIVGWYLGKADNNDERMSVALKYGIPVVGAVAITTMCAVGLIASGPSLLIGIASGAAINKLGEWVDKMRKKYKNKPLTLEAAAKKVLPNFKEEPDVSESKAN